MGVDTRANRIRRFYHEAFTARNWDYVRELIAPDARLAGGTGPDAKVRPIAQALAWLSDVTIDIQRLVASGDDVAVQFVLSATDTGGFAGRAPTGKRASAWGVEFWHFDGDQVAENWIGVDWLGLFIQLGVVTSPWPTASTA